MGGSHTTTRWVTSRYEHPIVALSSDSNQSRHGILRLPSRLLSVLQTLLPAIPSMLETSLRVPPSTNFSTSSTVAPPNRSASSPRSLASSCPSWTHLPPFNSMPTRSSKVIPAWTSVEDRLRGPSQPGHLGDLTEQCHPERVPRRVGREHNRRTVEG